jgi:tetratricopeptide (TPR) repeat protein
MHIFAHLKNKNLNILNTFLIFFSFLLAQESLANPEKAEILKGINFSIAQDYDRALATFAGMQAQYPQHPAGAFFAAAVWQTRMMDFETKQWEKNFYSEIDRAINLAKEKLNKSPQDSEMHFYYGAALGYKSFQLARDAKYMLSFQIGLNSIKELQKSLDCDSTFLDPYLGLGSYIYWRSNLTKKIARLPIFADKRSDGIDMITKVAADSSYSKWAAVANLAWILIEEHNYAAAQKYAQMGLQQFPDCRFFLWPLAEAQLKNKEYANALENLSKILASLQKESTNNHYNEILLHLKLAQCFQGLGNYDQAEKECQLVMSIKPDGEVKSRANNKKQEAKKIIKQLTRF